MSLMIQSLESKTAAKRMFFTSFERATPKRVSGMQGMTKSKTRIRLSRSVWISSFLIKPRTVRFPFLSPS